MKNRGGDDFGKARGKNMEKAAAGTAFIYQKNQKKRGVIGQPNIFGRALYMTRITVFGSCQPLA